MATAFDTAQQRSSVVLEVAVGQLAGRTAVVIASGVAVGFWRTWWWMAVVGVAVAWNLSWRFRRIEVDPKGLRLQHVVPFTQCVPFTALGEFTVGERAGDWSPKVWTPTPVAQAAVKDHCYRWAGILPARYLVIPPRYRVAGTTEVLPTDELVAILERFRTRGG